jgi:twinkle protein
MHLLTAEDIESVLAELETQDVRPAVEWLDGLLADEAKKVGHDLPWSKTLDRFWLRPSELTVWAGENGSGKSLLVGQVMAWLLAQTRVLIASMEMTPVETLRRMAAQAYGGIPPKEFKRRWLKWTGEGKDSRLMIYDQVDTVPADKILAMARHAATHLKCQHIVIDSLTKCGLPNGDHYDAQKRFIDRLAWVAKSTGVHIHLVAHLRKGEDDKKQPTKWDVRGASEITDLADNAILIWRNKAKEAARERAGLGRALSEKEDQTQAEPDTFMRIAKQRHHSWEGVIGLWWDRESGQFTTNGVQPYPVNVMREPGE